jgi:hypothetical protein
MKQKIYVFFGMIASGKSLLAQSFAKSRNIGCYNTDRVRKELAGVDPVFSCSNRLNMGIYSKECSLKTYGVLLERAREKLLQMEKGVVLDGSYASSVERGRVREFAAELDAEVIFILCRCPEDEVKRRLALRAQDPLAVSDGDWNIYLSQKQSFEFPDELKGANLIVMDTDHDVLVLLDNLDNYLKTNQ